MQNQESVLETQAPHLLEFYRLVSGDSRKNNETSTHGAGISDSNTADDTQHENNSTFSANEYDDDAGHVHGHSGSGSNVGNVGNIGNSNNSTTFAYTGSKERRQSHTSLNTAVSLSPSMLDLGTIISTKDKDDYQQILQEVHKSAQNYKKSLENVSKSASEFGAKLEKLARHKASEDQSNDLMSCSGLHYLIANHQQVLATSVEEDFNRNFEKIIEAFKTKTRQNDRIFGRELRSKVQKLRGLEKVNVKMSQSKRRNLITYKETLKRINDQINVIDALKYNYYDSLSKLIYDTNDNIIKKCSTVAKAEFEIYENIARKGWSGGGLDDLLVNCPDPFESNPDLFETDFEACDPTETANGTALFHTKISKAVHSRKPQLINTKDAMMDDSVVSPLASPMVSPIHLHNNNSSSNNDYPNNSSAQNSFTANSQNDIGDVSVATIKNDVDAPMDETSPRDPDDASGTAILSTAVNSDSYYKSSWE